MDGNLVGLVAVIMIFGIPMAAMYTFYHVRKLRTEERLAALARGVNVPMQPELSEAARSRRSGILLVTGALGYMLTFALIARAESDAWIARPARLMVRVSLYGTGSLTRSGAADKFNRKAHVGPDASSGRPSKARQYLVNLSQLTHQSEICTARCSTAPR